MPILEISDEDSECKHGICRKHNQILRLLNKVLKQRRAIGHLFYDSSAICNTQEGSSKEWLCYFLREK